MGSRQYADARWPGERGATLYMFTAALVLLAGMAGLAIDLASMYVAHNQAQTAADAAALAGAKYFVESGCVTVGNCGSFETTASARATEVAAQSNVQGQPVSIVSGYPSYNMDQPQDPRITVQVQQTNLHLYFLPAFADLASVVGAAVDRTTSFAVRAVATAEAYNPSGYTSGPTYCTGCVRPWLIANCDRYFGTTNSDCSNGGGGAWGFLLDRNNNYAVESPGCYPGGVVGEPVDIELENLPKLYGAVDITGGTGNYAKYQSAVPTCSIPEQTCGANVPFYVLPTGPSLDSATETGVENLLHVTAMNLGVGQDYIDTTACPPQIHAGATDPLVTRGVVAQDQVIATSDSIVTAYIFDGNITPQTVPGISQNLNVVGFAQIFVTQVDLGASSGKMEVQGVILGVAGCYTNQGACQAGAGNGSSINSPTLIPVRLIQPSS